MMHLYYQDKQFNDMAADENYVNYLKDQLSEIGEIEIKKCLGV